MITPQTEHPALAHAIGVPRLFLKREDLHPSGSHKGRSIPVMIDRAIAHGDRDFAISSSGNAALAAVRHIRSLANISDTPPLSLTVFISNTIDAEKAAVIAREAAEDPRISISYSPRPLQALFTLLKGTRHHSLRQSTDDEALVGYATLAEELRTIPDVSAVFIPTSSGTTAQALAATLPAHAALPVHIVQTISCHPMAEAFDATSAVSTHDAPNTTSEPSPAKAIVDRVAHRKHAVLESIRRTGGSGWIASNDDIRRAQELLRTEGIEATANGALGLAGLLHAISKGATFSGTVVCVITGK